MIFLLHITPSRLMFWRFGEAYLYPKRSVNQNVDDLSDTSRENVNDYKHLFSIILNRQLIAQCFIIKIH